MLQQSDGQLGRSVTLTDRKLDFKQAIVSLRVHKLDWNAWLMIKRHMRGTGYTVLLDTIIATRVICVEDVQSIQLKSKIIIINK